MMRGSGLLFVIVIALLFTGMRAYDKLYPRTVTASRAELRAALTELLDRLDQLDDEADDADAVPVTLTI
jgi:hypothetical protein